MRISINLHYEFHIKVWYSIEANDIGEARQYAIKKYAERAKISETEVVILELKEDNATK